MNSDEARRLRDSGSLKCVPMTNYLNEVPERSSSVTKALVPISTDSRSRKKTADALKGKSKGFIIRNNKKSSSKQPARRARMPSEDTDKKRAQSSYEQKPFKIYEENPFEELGRKRVGMHQLRTDYAR
jgi:hypothetical protein